MAVLPTNRTTANTASEHVADHNTLHSAFNARGIFLGVSDTILVAGTPVTAISATSLYPHWLLDAAITERVGGYTFIPADWATTRVTAFLSTAANTGGVRIALDRQPLADTAPTTGAPTSVSEITGTITAANTIHAMTLTAGTPLLGSVLALFSRIGAHGDDTLAGDVRFHGLLLEKAS